MDRFGVARKRQSLRRWVIDRLGGKCEICGYDRCLTALEAHHADPNTKDFNISDVTNVVRIELELRKCHLLCANCHREVHDGLHRGYLVLEGDFLESEFELPDDGLSYTEELELKAVLEVVEQGFQGNTTGPVT